MNDQDLYNEAMDPDFKPRNTTLFGQVDTNVWACALVKGQGKVPFDPEVHAADQRVIAIEITLTPLASSPNPRISKREMIRDSAEWAKTVLPSLKALQTDLNKLQGAYVRIELVPARTYTDKTSGEQKTATTFKFMEVYPSEDACEAAAAALFRKGGGTADGTAPFSTGYAPEPPVGGMSRDSALGFLKILHAQAKGDASAFINKLAATPAVLAHFPPDSKEVMDLVGVAA